MDRQIILDKLTSLKRCVERIESKVPENSRILMLDFDLQDIISLNLQRAVQVCVDNSTPLSRTHSYRKMWLSAIKAFDAAQISFGLTAVTRYGES